MAVKLSNIVRIVFSFRFECAKAFSKEKSLTLQCSESVSVQRKLLKGCVLLLQGGARSPVTAVKRLVTGGGDMLLKIWMYALYIRSM